MLATRIKELEAVRHLLRHHILDPEGCHSWQEGVFIRDANDAIDLAIDRLESAVLERAAQTAELAS
jgi:hypothetical protein